MLQSFVRVGAESLVPAFLLLSTFFGCSPNDPAGDSMGSTDRTSTTNRQAQTKNERTHVSALGRIEPEGTVVRLATPSGNEAACVSKLLVREGEDVKQGQVLAVLDTFQRRQSALLEAKANAAAARARLKQIEAGQKSGDIAAANAARELATDQMRIAKREWERAQKLVEANAISEEEVESREAIFVRAKHEMERSIGLLDSINEVRSIDVDVQLAMVTVAEDAIVTAEAHLEPTQVRSPSDSRVLKIYARPGEKPTDKGLFEIGRVSRMQTVAEVYEGDIALTKVGQRATMSLETAEIKFTGTVCEVGQIVARKVVLTNDPISDTDARIVEVRIDIDAEFLPKVQGLSNARVVVVIDIAGSALSVVTSGTTDGRAIIARGRPSFPWGDESSHGPLNFADE